MPNAIEQAKQAAADICGRPPPQPEVPWFWSDQYDAKLQIAGFGLGHDHTVTRPGTRPGSASVWYFREGRLIAVDAINDAKAYVIGKKMIKSGLSPTPEQAADPAADLKALLG